MKKNVLPLAVLAVFSLEAWSQATVTGTYLPVVNTEIRQVWNTDSAQNYIAAPSTGANQYWDYSQSFPTQAIKDTFTLRTIAPDHPDVVNLDGQQVHQYFPNSTIATFVRSPYDVADSLWSFFRVDTSGLYNIGAFALKSPIADPNIMFNDTVVYFEDEELIIPFDVNYGDHIEDTTVQVTYFDVNILGNIRPAKYKHTRRNVMDVSGYGTLKTPIAEYNDVLLGVMTIFSQDSLFLYNQTTQDYTDVVPLQSVGLNPQWTGKRHYFIRNNTFATNLLMQINTDTSGTQIDYGWYVLPTKVGIIMGTVYDSIGSTTPVTQGEVYLYREHGNFVRDDILATATIQPDGSFDLFDIPYGMYRIAARPDTAIYPGTYTTYYDEDVTNPSTDWLNCDLLVTVGDTSGVDIYIKHHDVMQNYIPNQMTGLLTYNSALKEGGNDPIPGIDVIIKKDPSSVPIISTQTDSSGQYVIRNLEDGDYTVWVDIPGLPLTSTYNFSVVNGMYNRCEFDFEAGNEDINRTGQNVNCLTSIEGNGKESHRYRLAPNPFSEETSLFLNIELGQMISVEVYDITGKLVQTVVSGVEMQGEVTLNISGLKESGIYFVKIKAGNRVETLRLIKL